MSKEAEDAKFVMNFVLFCFSDEKIKNLENNIFKKFLKFFKYIPEKYIL